MTEPDPVDLAASDEVAPGEIVSATIDDRDLVVWRTETGRPCVMDARCPHQWSHLEAEGAVVGEELLCTAHFWRFDTDGRGVKQAMSGRRDPKADIEVFETEERDGRILARIGRR